MKTITDLVRFHNVDDDNPSSKWFTFLRFEPDFSGEAVSYNPIRPTVTIPTKIWSKFPEYAPQEYGNVLAKLIVDACSNIAEKVQLAQAPGEITQERFAGLLMRILTEANKIRTETRRASGNLIVWNQNFNDMLGNAASPLIKPELDEESGRTKLIFNGVIECINSGIVGEHPEILVAYSGNHQEDHGIGFAVDTGRNEYAVIDYVINSRAYYKLIQLI